MTEQDILGFNPQDLFSTNESNQSQSSGSNGLIYRTRPQDSVSEDGIYRAKIKIIYNPENPRKSILEQQSYGLQDAQGFFTVISSLTVDDKSCPIFTSWKKCHYAQEGTALYNQALSKDKGGKGLYDRRFARYVIVQILKDKNVMIVLCGSSMSFIEKELLSEKNPLYGRATGVYKMTEMDFYDAVKFFPDYSDRDKVIAYSVLGGIPHYLKQFDPKISLSENIKQNILTKGCVLYSEVDFLLRQELRETPIYNSLIEAIALGNTKLNEISQKSLVDDTSKTSTYLRNLVQLGIVAREFSVDAGTKERANTNRGTYKLTDNFFRFWYAFVFANYSELEAGDVDGVFRYSVEPQLHQFASLPFENVCRQFVRKLQQANALPFRYASMGRWTGKTTVRDTSADNGTRIAETEIDILAVSQSRREYLVGECKFKNKPFSYSEYLDTIAKLSPQKEKADFYYELFSESGFDEKIIEAASNNERLLLYNLSDIVSGRSDITL